MRIQDRIARISKRIAGLMLNDRLFTQRTARNACDFIQRELSKYTHDVFNNADKKYVELQKAKDELFGYGMNLESKNEHQKTSENGSWKDSYHFSFANFENKTFTICVEFNVMLAGTVEDNELSYDFTVQAYDENTETQFDPPAIEHEIASMTRKKACNYIYRMLEKHTHRVYQNPNHHFDELFKTRGIVDEIGMENIGSERSDFHNSNGEVNGYSQLDTWRYLDQNLNEIKINIRWNVYYAGSINDMKNMYDFTVDVF